MFLVSLKRLAVSLSICLLALWAALFLQFKGERISQVNIGKIRIFLNPDGDFKLNFQNLAFFSDEKNCAELRGADGKTTEVSLVSAKKSEGGARLFFEGGAVLDAKQEGEGLAMSASLPAECLSLAVPLKVSEGGAAFARIDGGEEASLSAYSAPRLCEISRAAEFYKESKAAAPFKFADLQSAEAGDFLAQEARRHFFDGAPIQTEREAAAFIAERCAEGRADEVLGRKIASFGLREKGTFFTAPFFGGLRAKYADFAAQKKSRLAEILSLVAAKDEKIFLESGAFEALLSANRLESLREFSQIEAKIDGENPNFPLLTGILRAYSDFSEKNAENAANLEALAQNSAAVIEKKIERTERGLRLIGADFLSEGEKIALSSALFAYGKAKENAGVQNAADFLARSFFEESPISPLALAENYEILRPEKQWFPRTAVLSAPGFFAAAFCAAKRIWISQRDSSSVEISAEFQQGETEYIVFEGVPPFRRLEIHGLDYQSDANFESYNASGYVYDSRSQTLFLKLKHKAGAVEKFKFVF